MPSAREEMSDFPVKITIFGWPRLPSRNRLQIERNFPALSATAPAGERLLFSTTGISGRSSQHLTIRDRFGGANSGDRNLTPYSPDV